MWHKHFWCSKISKFKAISFLRKMQNCLIIHSLDALLAISTLISIYHQTLQNLAFHQYLSKFATCSVFRGSYCQSVASRFVSTTWCQNLILCKCSSKCWQHKAQPCMIHILFPGVSTADLQLLSPSPLCDARIRYSVSVLAIVGSTRLKIAWFTAYSVFGGLNCQSVASKFASNYMTPWSSTL